MSKNLTRKGLALGTAVAFVSTLLAGTAAQAATELKFESTYGGSNYRVPLNSYFELDASGTLVSSSSSTYLMVKVDNPSGVYIDAYGDLDDRGPYAANGDPADYDDTVQYFYGDQGGNGATQNFVIAAYDSEVESSATVTVFFDENDNGKLDSDEPSKFQIVQWVKSAAVTTLDQPFVNDTEITAHQSFTNGVNVEQLWESDTYYSFPDVEFTENGGDNYPSTDSDYNSTTKAIDYKWTATADAGDKFTAASYIDVYSDVDGVDWTKSGAKVSKSVPTVKTDDVDDAVATVTADVAEDNAGSYDYVVRAGTSTFTVGTTAYDSDDVALEGRPVRVSVNSISLAAKSTVKFLGKTVVSGDSSVVAYTTTDSKGKVSVPFIVSAKDGDDFNVDISVEGESTSVDAEVQKAYASTLSTLDNVGGDLAVKAGSTYKINYNLQDQFAQAWTAANYRVSIDSTGTANDKTYVFSGGKASATIIDESADGDTYTVYATLEKKSATDATWSDSVNSDLDNSIADIDVYALDNLSPTEVAIDTVDNEVDVTYMDFTNVDQRVGQDLNWDPYYDYTNISGTVVDADGNLLPGVLVTVSAAGAMLGSDGNDGYWVYKADSITVRTDSSGEFDVEYYSHKSGDQKVTVASGTGSDTYTVTTFKPELGDTDAGFTLALSAPSKVYTSGGRAVAVRAIVTDKWGNGFKSITDPTDEITFDVEGVGYLSDDAVNVSSKGAARSTLLVDVYEAGAATVTAHFDDGSSDGLDATLNLLFGVKAVVTAKPAAGATVSVKHAKGATIKVVRGTKSITKVATAYTQLVTLKTGTGTVKVYVNGVLVLVK